jgi:hypothetical protein
MASFELVVVSSKCVPARTKEPSSPSSAEKALFSQAGLFWSFYTRFEHGPAEFRDI